MLGECKAEWFERREELVELFNNALATFNSESGSTTLNQYREKARLCEEFLEDLLRLRMFLRYLDNEAIAAFEKVVTPLKPVILSSAGEEIAIGLEHTDDTSFQLMIQELLSGAYDPSSQTLVRAYLYQFDTRCMHKCFKGNKFRSMSGKGFKDHIDKYFEQLCESIQSAGRLRTSIAINGKSLDDMSPGMKAQALLKLFLNDGITNGNWMYIVLDQPEDNLDVATIKDFLINRIKALKLNIQFFVVSHSAPVIVNGDARTVVVSTNDDGDISYSQGAMNDQGVKQSIADVLDGGERYLKMRLNKYNFQVGDER